MEAYRFLHFRNSESKNDTRRSELLQIFEMPILANTSLKLDNAAMEHLAESLRATFSPPVPTDMLCGLPVDGLLLSSKHGEVDFTADSSNLSRSTIQTLIAEAHDVLAPLRGGCGSLRRLSPDSYTTTRRLIIQVCLNLSGLASEFALCAPFHEKEVGDHMHTIWRYSLKIIEDGVRKAISPGRL